jgi:hypothetical protein
MWILSSDLAAPHSGPRYTGAYNLRAITGEDYDYNIDGDLIDNPEAIDAWKKRADDPRPLLPGGWAIASKL